MEKLPLIMLMNCTFAVVLLLCVVHAQQELRQRLPDVGLNVFDGLVLDSSLSKQLIEMYGYPFENHTIQTEDGYLIELHRIPDGREHANLEQKPVVLLMPGLLCSAADWVNMGPEKSLGFILADQGYDVWLVNYRGTTWSRKHATLNPDKDKDEYWSFSFHEIGNYDLKESIDYVLHTTNQEKVFYIGHSQGTTSLMALLSVKPEYNEKVRLATLFAPVVYVENMRSPFIRLLAKYKDTIQEFVDRYKFYEIAPHYPIITTLGQIFCNDDSPFQTACASIFYIAAGFSPKQMNKTMIPVITSNTPAGSSIRQYQHYAQFIDSKSFHQYDYGEAENLIRYGQPEPPQYDLSNVATPMLFYYGSRDALCSGKDVDRLATQVSTVVLKRRIRGFNHLDYMWGNDAVKSLYKEVLETMRRYS